VELIDQTALPAEVRMLRVTEVDRQSFFSWAARSPTAGLTMSSLVRSTAVFVTITERE
jgi:hypothetical protein